MQHLHSKRLAALIGVIFGLFRERPASPTLMDLIQV